MTGGDEDCTLRSVSGIEKSHLHKQCEDALLMEMGFYRVAGESTPWR